MKKYFLSLVFGISIISLFAQTIPNGGFETTSNWMGINHSIVSSVSVITTDGKSTLYPVEGSRFLLIENSDTLGNGYAKNSFAFTGRPDTFSFHFGYLQGNLAERMSVAVTLSKWDADSIKRDIVCQFSITAPDTDRQIKPWTVINIPLNSFYKSTETPDSALILFQNDFYSNSTLTTFLVVDEVKFSRQDSSGKTWVSILNHDLILNQVFYSSNKLYINSCCKQNLSNALVSVYNVNGQMVYTSSLNLISGINSQILNLPFLSTGIYILNILTVKGSLSAKFIVH